MECDIIRDLLPLYADGLASEASSSQINAHTARCPACRKLLEEMTAPMEPEPQDEERRAMEILQAHYKKQRRRTILSWIAALLAVVLVIWGIMEVSYSGEEIYVSSTNEERLRKEMPGLVLTDAEKALAKTILEVPMVRDALGDTLADAVSLDAAGAAACFSGILPADAQVFDIFVMGHSVWFSYAAGNVYTCITYTDADMTGHVDTITKTVTVSPLDEIGPDGVLGDVDAIYELTHDVATGISRYQKIKSRHMWFSFLDFA